MTSYQGADIYCGLIIPRKVDIRVVRETGHVLAYHHTRPHWPVHIIVTPKKHVASLLEMGEEPASLAKELFEVLSDVARQIRDNEGACRIITNLGGYQDSKHLHLHVVSGKQLD